MKRLLLLLALLIPGSLYAQGGCVLQQSTAGQELKLGRFVDSTDGNTEETGLTIANTDIRIKKGAADWASKNSGGATHEEAGNYRATFDATDTNTLGILEIAVHVAGALSVEKTCLVVAAASYDVNVNGNVADQSDLETLIAALQATADAIETRTPEWAVISGTSDSGSTTTMVDAARTEADNDWWKGSLIRFTSGTVSGQVRLITGFTAASDTITFAPATTATVGTQTYEILPSARVDLNSLLGTTMATPATAGIPDVNAKNINNVAAVTQPTNFNLLAIDANGRGQVQVGTSAGQINAAAGVVPANVTQFGGTNGTFASGIPAVNVTQISGDSAAADNAESEYDGTGFGVILQRTTIATLAAQDDFTLTAGSSDNNAYNNAVVIIQDATTAAQKAFGAVDDYVGSTKQLTLQADPGIFTMAVGDIVTIVAASSAGMGGGDATLSNQTQILTDIAALDTKATAAKTVIDSIKVDTGTTIPARLPAALVGGKMDANVGTVTAGAVTAAGLAANAINASKIDSDVATELQAGLVTFKRATAATFLARARTAGGGAVTGATPACQFSRDGAALSGTGITATAEIANGVHLMAANGTAMTGNSIYLYCTFSGGSGGTAVAYEQFLYTQQ